jgi:hypothetical protein
VLRLDRLRALVDVYPGVDREDEMVAAFDYCLHGKGGAAPSIDTAMHGLVDAAHVDHLHPDSGIAIATAKDGEALTTKIFGDKVAGFPGAAPASSWAWTSPRSRTPTRRPSAPSWAGTASPPGAPRPKRPSQLALDHRPGREVHRPERQGRTRSVPKLPGYARCPRPSGAPRPPRWHR